MSEFPLGYEKIAPATWAYLSSLLMIGLFFKFNRTWSMRNLDLILLILLAPGMLLVVGGDNLEATYAVSIPELSEDGLPSQVPIAPAGDSIDLVQRGQWLQFTGYIWLFVVGLLLLIRMLLDATMTRRPLLEPNLSMGGMIFFACSMSVFLMINVIVSNTTIADLDGAREADQMVNGGDSTSDRTDRNRSRHGPGYALLHLLPKVMTVGMSANDGLPAGVGEERMWNVKNKKILAVYVKTTPDRMVWLQPYKALRREIPLDDLSDADRKYLSDLKRSVVISKTMAILAHLAVVVGITMIGYRHFDSVSMGIGAATIYLILPYTVQMTGRVEHVIPAALLVWAIYFYRQPLGAGIFIGLAAGVVYYPLFLLPLWISFYWQRGLLRFTVGVLSMLFVLAITLLFDSGASYWENVQRMFGIWLPVREGLEGVWGLGWDPWFRLPVLVLFFALSISFAMWPAQKNMGTLLSCSAALMVATQFWHGYGGGLYMGWYLPLLLLTVFRPNLEDRVALTVLGEGWLSRRRREQSEKKTDHIAA